MKCRHPCLGLCGETCPKLCRICTPDDEAFTIFFGNEEDPEARFIQLECNHIFEATGFDTLMDQTEDPSQNASIQFKSCPKCKIPIRKIQRYNNVTKRVLADVAAVKAKVTTADEQGVKVMTANKSKIRGAALSLRSSFQELAAVQAKFLERLETSTSATTVEHIAEKVAVLGLLINVREMAGAAGKS